MEADEKKHFKKLFPNLMREIETGEAKVPIDSVEDEPETVEDTAELVEETVFGGKEVAEAPTEPDKFRHYCPDFVDFLRRCDTEAQAEEIIAYMQKRGELTVEKACELRAQLKRDGVRSFGPKKDENYYFKESGLC